MPTYKELAIAIGTVVVAIVVAKMIMKFFEPNKCKCNA